MRAISLSSRQFQLPAAVVLFALICCAWLPAQDSSTTQAEAASAIAVRPLITQPLDEAQLTVLKGNTHPLARPEFDLGTAPASLPMQRMLLVLKRSPEQEFALNKLLDDQQDKASPNYHKWLSPEQFGKQFGPTDADIQTITAWLQSHGFQVGSTKGRTVLEFSGSASQVREAFHTAIHKYVVKGEQHWANASDPQIPAALTHAVSGVFTLHNFLKKPHVHVSEQRVGAKFTPGKKPEVSFSDGTNTLGPQDYATIYNITPTYSNGINGSGVTIGVVGRSNLFNGAQDVADFRFSVFGLCCGNFNILLNGPDPGDLGGGEEAEATLDTAWSGAIAPSANVELVVSASTNSTDGVDLSELYIVENNLADVMTESFGSCELGALDADFQGVNRLAEQAAAQGITYMVSTGDNGAEGCDDPNSASASFPVSVNLLASTPFDIAVGGTMFNENKQNSTYWGTSPPVTETALSYIPENVWNESCSTSSCGANANLSAGSGGASTGNVLNGGTFAGFPKPSWQSGVTGIPNDNHRDLPDVSLTAASHDPYLLCLQGSCSQGFIYFVWGTSAAAPSFAGVMALIDQNMANLGQSRRQGQANYVLYKLAANETFQQCNGSSTSNPLNNGTDGCVFNDTTVGNNSVPGESGYPNGFYGTTAGYDMATGLGSVNVANLVANWNTIAFNATTTTLLLNNGNPVSVPHGTSVPVHISVTSNTGMPSGDVSVLAGTGAITGQTSVGDYTLAGGVVGAPAATDQLPGGTYNVTAHYAGDGTHAPSDSNAVPVTIISEASTTGVTGPFTQDQFGLYRVPFTSGPYGSPVFVRADVQGASGKGVPTGTVVFSDSTGSIPPGLSAPLLNSEGNTSIQSVLFDDGTHTISAAYGADFSFNSSMSTQNPDPNLRSVTFTIQPGFFTALAGPPFVVIGSAGQSGSIPLNVFASTGFSSAVTFSCSGLPVESACAFSPSSVTGNGQTTVTVTTTAPHVTQLREQRRYYFATWLTGGGFLLAGLFCIGSPRRRRHALPLLLIVVALLVVIPACGGGGGGHHQQDPGTPAGQYTVKVTATGGSLTQTTSFLLVVQ